LARRGRAIGGIVSRIRMLARPPGLLRGSEFNKRTANHQLHPK
jgi:hypothetical protein